MPGRSYEEMRGEYRPAQVRLLLIGESAPDPREAQRRFFYAPALAPADNLFRGVVEALYDHRFPRGSAGTSKVPWLERLRRDGVYLIDLVPFPVNGLTRGRRARARRDHLGAAVEEAGSLSPAGVAVCHAPTFRLLATPLRRPGFPCCTTSRFRSR